MSDREGLPRVSLALIAFNQESYIREAVESVLAQTYPNLEIILSDDCSRDRTFEIMRSLVDSYAGLHTLVLNRNERNLGPADHLNAIMRIASGRLVVVAAGDDISLPERTTMLVEHWLAAGGGSMSIFSAMVEIRPDSSETGRILRRTSEQMSRFTLREMSLREISVFGASQAWTPDTFSRFGDIHPQVINEDVVIPFRAALAGTIHYIDRPLVKYRRNIGLASGYSNGRSPSRKTRRSPALLKRPYFSAVQKHHDYRSVGARPPDLEPLLKMRRAETLLRYWLASRRKVTRARIAYFVRRSRLAWIGRELAYVLRDRLECRLASDKA